MDDKEREKDQDLNNTPLLVVIKGSYPPSAAICSLFFPLSSAMLLSSKPPASNPSHYCWTDNNKILIITHVTSRITN